MKPIFIVLLFFLFQAKGALFAAIDHSYPEYTAFLQKYVSSTGKVNYKGILKDRAALDRILETFSENPPTDTWSSNEKLAYWINVYNAFTIRLVIDHYPLASIQDIGHPWDQKIVRIGEKKYTLNEIENTIIRKQFQEPRVHFALNCASKSCPMLYNKAFQAKYLDFQLSKQTGRFLNDPNRNDLSDPKHIVISKIFDWYKSDFSGSGGVVAFIERYSDASPSKNTQISYKEYSWKLNE